ncbi:M48 family metallopeptidase [Streptomyces sp. NPDC058872]|uniref:M48 family metallopeptidase n=1 Tax=Streptomyces sp. NPDC058872 TaxID=3346661 RepID=UPI00369976E5
MARTAHTIREAAHDCPECGQALTGGGHYVAWCTACAWNVDPEPPEETPGRIEGLRRRLAHQYGEQLLAELTDPTTGTTAELPASGHGRAGRLATVLAAAVHGVTVVLFGTGLWLLVGCWGRGALPVVGGLLIFLALVLRPRFKRLAEEENHRRVLHRADAPRLFALLDEVAEAVGTTGVRTVVVDARVNASVGSYGIRQHRVLHIGLGIWEVLSPQERIALLGHEFGHYAHGDTRHLLLVGSAFQTLATWRYALAPAPARTLIEHFTNLVLALPRLLVNGLLIALVHLTLRHSQRAEYLADSSAARVGGGAAAARLMNWLIVTESITGMLHREHVAARTRMNTAARHEGPAEELWERLAARAASIPEHEHERLRRVAELRGHQVDSTHPPTHLRRRRLIHGMPSEPLLVLDPVRVAAIDAELADARRSVARELVRS